MCCRKPSAVVWRLSACCRHQKLKFRHNLYKLREERNIKPSTFGELVSSMLYEKRCASHSCQPGFGFKHGPYRGNPSCMKGVPIPFMRHLLLLSQRQAGDSVSLMPAGRSLYAAHEGSRVKGQSSWQSTMRYRFGPYFVSPVIAGLDEKTSEPYICGMDTIGAIETAKDFMVAGTAPDSLYGMCESMWQPDMVSVLSQNQSSMLV